MQNGCSGGSAFFRDFNGERKEKVIESEMEEARCTSCSGFTFVSGLIMGTFSTLTTKVIGGWEGRGGKAVMET